MIVEGFDSKAFDAPTEKMSDAEGIQRVCVQLQKYLLAMARSSYNVGQEDIPESEKMFKALGLGSEIMEDYCEQTQIYSKWLSDHAIQIVNSTMEALLSKTALMTDDERLAFLSAPTLFIDTNNCDIEDVTRQHGEEVGQFVRNLRFQQEQRQMESEINSLIHGGSVTASESDNFIRMTQRHEEENFLRKKNSS